MKEKKIKDRWNELPWLYKIQLWAVLFAGICGAIAYPLTTKLIYSLVETETLASRLVLSSLIGIVLSILWLSIQEKLYKYFIHFTQKITDVEQYRTDYGFFIEIVSCLGVLLGSAIAVIFDFTMPVAFLLLLVSLIGFEITDIYVYLSVKIQEEKQKK